VAETASAARHVSVVDARSSRSVGRDRLRARHHHAVRPHPRRPRGARPRRGPRPHPRARRGPPRRRRRRGQPRRRASAAGPLPPAARAQSGIPGLEVSGTDRGGRRRGRGWRSATRSARCSPAAGMPSWSRPRWSAAAGAGGGLARQRRGAARGGVHGVVQRLPHGALQPGETLLVHGGSSGIGTMAIQLGARDRRRCRRHGRVGRRSSRYARPRRRGARQLPRGRLRRAP
jgi:hypothetical protein